MESYKHKYAKQILKDWLKDQFIRIELEQNFYLDGRLLFIPDITCYDKEGINTIYEIVHKHELDAKKLSRMQFYFYLSDLNINIFEVKAEWIMSRIEKPETIKAINMSLPEFTF